METFLKFCAVILIIYCLIMALSGANPGLNPVVANSAENTANVVVNALHSSAYKPVYLNLARSHAFAKHGAESATVADACNNGGHITTWRKQFWYNGDYITRRIHVCSAGGGFGLWIVDYFLNKEEEEVTAFLRRDRAGNLVKILQEVLDYIKGTGYKCELGC